MVLYGGLHTLMETLLKWNSCLKRTVYLHQAGIRVIPASKNLQDSLVVVDKSATPANRLIPGNVAIPGSMVVEGGKVVPAVLPAIQTSMLARHSEICRSLS